jgi:hypothetical protein
MRPVGVVKSRSQSQLSFEHPSEGCGDRDDVAGVLLAVVGLRPLADHAPRERWDGSVDPTEGSYLSSMMSATLERCKPVSSAISRSDGPTF